MHKGKLFRAVAELDLKTARLCLEAEPELVDATDSRDRDLLQVAASAPCRSNAARARKQIALLDFLAGCGLDMHRRYGGDCEGEGVNLVWHAVCKSRHPAVVSFLLERGGEPDGLYAAAWNEDADLVALLGAAGIEVDPVVFDETPLMHALRYRKFKALEPLLDIGADINWRDSKARTVLHVALERGFPADVFKLLLRRGADPDLPDAGGRTVRAAASRKRDKSWAKIIEQVVPA